jgi:hypothetical protein
MSNLYDPRIVQTVRNLKLKSRETVNSDRLTGFTSDEV